MLLFLHILYPFRMPFRAGNSPDQGESKTPERGILNNIFQLARNYYR